MSQALQAPETVGFSSERLARIKPSMQAYVDQRGYAGISTMVARRGQVVHFEQVGYQDRDERTPLTADSIYRIYSMTKPIICTALMTLHEEGRFQLIDPVAKFLPAFGKVRVLTADGKEEDVVRPMTIRDLFTHMAGLTYNFLEDSPVGKLYLESGMMSDSQKSLEALIGELARFPLAYQPGSRFHYSMSIDVLAHLSEVISGQPLQDFLQERLFGPLGMHDTGFSVPAEKQHRIATVYGHPDVATHSFNQLIAAWQAGFNERIDVDSTYPASGAPNFARGGHGLFSTAGDYMRFAQMLLNRGKLDGVRILSRKTTDLMHSNHVPTKLLPYQIGPLPSEGYGFGLGSRVLLNVAESAVPGSVGEFGWAGAANTYYWVDPQEEIIGVFMSQFMMSFEVPSKDFQVLVYQALAD
ncbi:MAG: serine hydrolase domain-containing protein [Caldilineaceae bacterium]